MVNGLKERILRFNRFKKNTLHDVDYDRYFKLIERSNRRYSKETQIRVIKRVDSVIVLASRKLAIICNAQ